MNKKDIKQCRFPMCKHATRRINIAEEPFVKEGTMYYHEDCYEIKKKNEWKSEQTKKDLAEFRDLWWKYISKTVNFAQLMTILNDYVAKEVPSDYLLYALKYCIRHHFNLNYPNGFKYFVDKREIKVAYERHLIRQSEVNKQDTEIEKKDKEEPPQFKVQNKPRGFQSILE